jgi:hypothetical protein
LGKRENKQKQKMEVERLMFLDEDAENDVNLYFKEEMDLEADSMINSDNYGGIGCAEIEMEDVALQHLKNLNFLKFANSVLNSEIASRKRRRADSWEMVMVEPKEAAKQRVFPFAVPLQNIPSVQKEIEHHQSSSTLTARIKQLKKDLERDKLLINNNRLIGATIGLAGILSTMETLFDELMEENSLPPLSKEVKEQLSYGILLKSARTHSGAMVLHVLQNIVDTNTTLILPQSAVVPPIKIKIGLDAIPDQVFPSFTTSWGIAGKISCEFIYSLYSREEIEVNCAPEEKKIEGNHAKDEKKETNTGTSQESKDEAKKEENDQSLSSMLMNRTISLTYEDFLYFPINLCDNMKKEMIQNEKNRNNTNNSILNAEKEPLLGRVVIGLVPSIDKEN